MSPTPAVVEIKLHLEDPHYHGLALTIIEELRDLANAIDMSGEINEQSFEHVSMKVSYDSPG